MADTASDSPAVSSGLSPAWRHVLGRLCLLVAMAWGVALFATVDDRIARDMLEIEGTVASAEFGRTTRPSGVALVGAPALWISLESPRFLEGRYQPAFRFSPLPWSGDAAEALAAGLKPGAAVRLTVARADLEGVMERLTARDRLEREGRVYSPSPFERPAAVAIVSVGGESAQLTESPLVFVAAIILCLAGAAFFAAAGASLLRRRATPA